MKILMIAMCLVMLVTACDVADMLDPNRQLREQAQSGTCRANMRTLASQEVIYFAQHNKYTDNIYDLGIGTLQCPEYGTYLIETNMENSSFTITCRGNHGCIDNGVSSWLDASE